MRERLYIRSKESTRRTLDAPFVGFTPEQADRITTHIENIGLPVDNISTVVYRPNQKGENNVLGSYEPNDGIFTLYKSLDELPPVAQHGTIVHELAHSSSPFDEKNQRFYGSPESMTKAREQVQAVSKQSLETGRYLNGYQAYLAKQLEAGQINIDRFVEETHAILIELRFNNFEHLKQVNEAQKAQVNKMNGSEKFVDILSGVDSTLISLIPQVNSKEELDKHVNSLKQTLIAKRQPLLPNQRLPLAA